MRLSLLITYFLILSSSLIAQQDLPRVTVRGEIVSDDGNFPNDLTLELHSLSGIRPPARIAVMNDGRFEDRNVEVGPYNVAITDGQGSVIQEDYIDVRETSGWVQLRLHERSKKKPAGSAVISVKELMHPVPSKASAEFRRANAAARAGDVKQSIAHLEKAVRIYPNYVGAHNNLGVGYLNLRQLDKAATEFRKTIEIDPSAEIAHSNLALALLSLGNLDEAEREARKAVELNPKSIPAHYVLGQTLFSQQKYTLETLDSLRKTTDEFPFSRLLVAQILLVRGEISGAIAEYEKYLQSGKPEKRDEVQAFLELAARMTKP
jgi:tetratricopeptide (TPR) repeat protein